MEKTRHIDGVTVGYTVEGTGSDTVVLLHGWGCTRETLASIAATCLAAGCRILNIDFPGFGRSDEPPFPWGVEQYTVMLEKLLAAEGIERPVLLGHSFGGRVAILYASRNDVGKVILVDAAGVKPRRRLSYYYKVYKFKLGKILLKLALGPEKAQARIDAARSRKGSSDYSAASPMMRRVLSKVVNEDLRHVMPDIKSPTLLIWGENDTATPIHDAQIMEKRIPGAGLVSFPGCGHYSFLDNPRQFAAVLLSFLKS